MLWHLRHTPQWHVMRERAIARHAFVNLVFEGCNPFTAAMHAAVIVAVYGR